MIPAPDPGAPVCAHTIRSCPPHLVHLVMPLIHLISRSPVGPVLAAGLLCAAALAAPAPWYYWRSQVDGKRICAQTSPGAGWTRDSDAFEGPGCQPRRRVIVVPMR